MRNVFYNTSKWQSKICIIFQLNAYNVNFHRLVQGNQKKMIYYGRLSFIDFITITFWVLFFLQWKNRKEIFSRFYANEINYVDMIAFVRLWHQFSYTQAPDVVTFSCNEKNISPTFIS